MSYILPPDPLAIETAVATNADAITANSTTLSLHGPRLDALEAADLVHDADIAANVTAIGVNATDIDALQTLTGAHTSSISTNATNISTNTSNIATNTTNIGTNTSGIAAIIASKGAASGIATLDGSTKLPSAQLPAGVYAGGNLVVNGGITQSTAGALSLLLYNSPGPEGSIQYIAPNSILRMGYCYPEVHNGAATSSDYAQLTGTVVLFVSDPTNFARYGRTGVTGTDAYMESYYGSAAASVQVKMSAADTALKMAHSNLGNSMNLGENDATWTWVNVYGKNAYTTVSDRKAKTKIKPERKGLKFITKLKPRKWKKKDNGKRVHHGLIAQEVEELLKENPEFMDSDGEDGFVCKETEFIETQDDKGNVIRTGELRKNEDGTDYYHYALRYGELWGPMIAAVQELATEQESIKARLDALELKK